MAKGGRSTALLGGWAGRHVRTIHLTVHAARDSRTERPAEAVPRHVDVASEVALVGIEGRDGVAFRGREEPQQDGATVAVELARERLPVISANARLCRRNRRGRGDCG